MSCQFPDIPHGTLVEVSDYFLLQHFGNDCLESFWRATHRLKLPAENPLVFHQLIPDLEKAAIQLAVGSKILRARSCPIPLTFKNGPQGPICELVLSETITSLSQRELKCKHCYLNWGGSVMAAATTLLTW